MAKRNIVDKTCCEIKEWQKTAGESVYNIGAVTREEGIKTNSPNPKYELLPLKNFIGNFVKTRFDYKERREYMWVHVKKIDGEFLVGVLNNDPVFCANIKCGDEVRLKRDAVINMMYGK